MVIWFKIETEAVTAAVKKIGACLSKLCYVDDDNYAMMLIATVIFSP